MIIISPAKTLDLSPSTVNISASSPRFKTETQSIADVLHKLSQGQTKKLMSLSPALAKKVYEQHQNFGKKDNLKKIAIDTYRGAVYKEIQLQSYNKSQLEYLNSKLRMISGLYGLLRPADLIEPYRLEMGTDIEPADSQNLYDFWSDRIAKKLDQDANKEGSTFILNLASDEYYKAVAGKLKTPVYKCTFKEDRDGKLKVIAFSAKKARGAMCHYLIENKVKDLKKVQKFESLGYRFNPKLSKDDEFVFVRK